MKPRSLRSVRVGDRIRLLPDEMVRLKHNDYRCNPNSSLGIAMDEWHTVSEVLVTDGIVLVGVEDSFKRVDMRRFTSTSLHLTA